MSEFSQSERREVLYRGRVQGVGFRYTTRRIAGRYAVSGFVRNLSDGSVQLVAEGEKHELQQFLADLGNVMKEYISTTEVQSTGATGEFPGFEIRP